jgi:hypothetical protein
MPNTDSASGFPECKNLPSAAHEKIGQPWVLLWVSITYLFDYDYLENEHVYRLCEYDYFENFID